MIKQKPMAAWIISAVLGVLLLTIICAALTKVDIVYMKDGMEIGRQENVCALSKIDNYFASGDDLAFTYVDGEETVEFDNKAFSFRIFIAKTVITNIIEFNFNEESNVIVITAE